MCEQERKPPLPLQHTSLSLAVSHREAFLLVFFLQKAGLFKLGTKRGKGGAGDASAGLARHAPQHHTEQSGRFLLLLLPQPAGNAQQLLLLLPLVQIEEQDLRGPVCVSRDQESGGLVGVLGRGAAFTWRLKCDKVLRLSSRGTSALSSLPSNPRSSLEASATCSSCGRRKTHRVTWAEQGSTKDADKAEWRSPRAPWTASKAASRSAMGRRCENVVNRAGGAGWCVSGE